MYKDCILLVQRAAVDSTTFHSCSFRAQKRTRSRVVASIVRTLVNAKTSL